MENVKKRIVTKWSKTVRPNSKTEKSNTIPTKDKKEEKPSKSESEKKPRKKYKLTWTVKQKRAIEILNKKVEKGGNVNLQEVLLESWYSKNTAKTPQKVFQKWIVNEKLKIVGITGTWREEKHQFLLNNRIRQTVSYPIETDQKEVIKKYKEEFPWSRCYNIFQEGAYNIFEFSVPNSSDVKSALEFSYKHFPVEPKKTEIANTWKSKRLQMIEELASKQWIHIKKPIKLCLPENLSQS